MSTNTTTTDVVLSTNESSAAASSSVVATNVPTKWAPGTIFVLFPSNLCPLDLPFASHLFVRLKKKTSSKRWQVEQLERNEKDPFTVQQHDVSLKLPIVVVGEPVPRVLRQVPNGGWTLKHGTHLTKHTVLKEWNPATDIFTEHFDYH